MGSMTRTFAELVQARWQDHRPGLAFEDQVLSHHQVAAGAAARAALLGELLPRGAVPHIGVLLDNTPEFPQWLGAAALAGAAVAGINPTRRGAELARDITHTECRVLITERAHLPLLDGLRLPGVRVLVTDTGAYAELLADYAGAEPEADGRAGPGAHMLLYFTSGSTGAPKAAICTQGRLAAAGQSLVGHFGVRADDVHYICMPLFHGNAVIADWAPAMAAGAGVALRRRFSASRFLGDVRKFGATYFTYVGRAVQYLLATEERADDRDNPLRVGFGTEAGAVDAARFEERFGVRLVEGYGSSEGGAAVQRTADTPPGAIGRAVAGDDLAVLDPVTRAECPAAVFDAGGRLLNGAAAIGELVNRGRSPFEGYWRNDGAYAERVREDGWYWTGDLFFRDADGFLYFAGRGDDKIRVDSENLAPAMIENILARWREAAAVAVYGVPDPVSGDQVMATVALRPGVGFDPLGFGEFLLAQGDLGTKMAPRFVRVVERMPVTATNKVRRGE
ncbi:AMP-binding protein, partial [Streptomyces longispororuber]|uniref:AMP-binding protein n=1 Tax=Streptomyces longispororuber TaxID=68230 RepID=UPI00210D571C